MAWARAFSQYGLEYYPKLLCAAPFSPVTGPRLIGRNARPGTYWPGRPLK
ncbi:hypothetical protein TKWG_16400 [Advenella kashmirensis WT001]|uniref:Uncharacterized protein n=1 Tax=Advenella kashmirensis (strain DSM 17095 / LMG 22695 / WT001) TaxID=1036672 RepID=I3UDZ1_ADVKW|nr:hypothetical protein TKWG_16400 [Advenella kashmirensis WT001]